MTLIAIDLDGTLLSHDGTISEENREVIKQAQRQGNTIAISSGRSLHDTQEILHLAGLDCSIITGNGAVVFHAGERIQHLIIPVNVMTDIMDLIEKIGLYYEIYTNQGVYIEEDGKQFLMEEIEHMQEQTGNLDVEHAYQMLDTQSKQGGITYVPDYHAIDFKPLEVYKLFVLSFDQEKRDKLQEQLAKRNDISLTTSGQQKLEIAHPKASKGNALQFFANYMGIELENTVAMGDNLNDVSMFEVAGLGIAMGNAEEKLKEVADYVSVHHENNGVAYGLKKWVLQED
ncbi:Cof-type HAD-IIB family hydrolase [Lentibacillus sp. L22]|uniref:Cof-type HAD-IIB family hydrolase n=1 Tax=Lentibacillus TaxID=175304 RepID=UPI0022B198D7|nr:Cof-type HAD-IIB family hydrolase [Lentibacillus daqui]